LIELGGWRFLTDPTFDRPGERYFFGWGTMSRKLTGPAITPTISARSTPCWGGVTERCLGGSGQG
jgi:hypothetical protein